MAYILNIETATTNCSVALSSDKRVLVLKEDNSTSYSHAERLHVYIDAVLQEAGLKASELDAIAVSKGPGSFTGLRIGVSAAKGLCFALDIPLISVPTLQALAHQVKPEKGVIIPMLDARRMEVYCSAFDSKYRCIMDTKAEILDEGSFARFLEQGPVYFIGNGTEKSQAIINHPNAVFTDNKLPSAREMGALAFSKFKAGSFEDVAYFEPYYLKDFVTIKHRSVS